MENNYRKRYLWPAVVVLNVVGIFLLTKFANIQFLPSLFTRAQEPKKISNLATVTKHKLTNISLNSFAVQKDTQADTQYSSKQIIVRLKTSAGKQIQKKFSSKATSIQTTGLKSLDALNRKHKAKQIEPLIPALKVQQLKTNESEAKILAKTQAKFPLRTKRSSAVKITPSLSEYYLITF